MGNELLIKSRKTGKIVSEHQTEDEPQAVQATPRGRYYTYIDYVPDLKSWSEMTADEWELFIGFILIRMISPLFLIIHTVAIFGYIWKKFNFKFDTPELAKMYSYLISPLCGNLLIVQFLNKFLFRKNYYRQRSDDDM